MPKDTIKDKLAVDFHRDGEGLYMHLRLEPRLLDHILERRRVTVVGNDFAIDTSALTDSPMDKPRYLVIDLDS
jgi:hypothetical protein